MSDSPIKPVDREELKRLALAAKDSGRFPEYVLGPGVLSLLSTIEELERENERLREENPKAAVLISQEKSIIAAEALLREAVEVVKGADAALHEAEAILGGEYADQHGALFELIQTFREALSTLLSKLTEGRS